jgi:hypothetical protein
MKCSPRSWHWTWFEPHDAKHVSYAYKQPKRGRGGSNWTHKGEATDGGPPTPHTQTLH